MCLAVPGEIVQIDDGVATVRIGEALRKASLLLLPEEPKPGDYVIVHAGFALNVLDPAEAAGVDFASSANWPPSRTKNLDEKNHRFRSWP